MGDGSSSEWTEMGQWEGGSEERRKLRAREIETLGSARCGGAHFNPGTLEAEVGRSLCV